MDKWFKDILSDKNPYHNRGRDQMRKKGGPEFECLCVIPQALGYTLWFSLFSLKLNIFPFSASILTFSTQKLNHLILTYFTHFDTTHFFYKYYNINKASNSPPFFWLLYIMKFHQPRFNSRFLHGMSLSRRNSRGRRFLVYIVPFIQHVRSPSDHNLLLNSHILHCSVVFLNLRCRKSLQLF